MLTQYKQILASILPSSMLTVDGVLKTPQGEPERIRFVTSPDYRKVEDQEWYDFVQDSISRWFPTKCDGRAYYLGELFAKVLRYRLARVGDSLPSGEQQALSEWAERQITGHAGQDVISTRNSIHKGVLAHETFHDIQGFLLDYYPQVLEKLLIAVDEQKEAIVQWHKDPANARYVGPPNYRLEDFFPDALTTIPFFPSPVDAMNYATERTGKQWGEALIPMWEFIGSTCLDMGRIEVIPTLLSAASEGSAGAICILSHIFRDAGLNPNFHYTLPRV